VLAPHREDDPGYLVVADHTHKEPCTKIHLLVEVYVFIYLAEGLHGRDHMVSPRYLEHGIRILIFVRVGVYCRLVNGTASATRGRLDPCDVCVCVQSPYALAPFMSCAVITCRGDPV